MKVKALSLRQLWAELVLLGKKTLELRTWATHYRGPLAIHACQTIEKERCPDTKVYQAPFQVKANGGVLIIDDFGRQRVPPRDLLNRWIVPLEKRVDFLTLHTGTKFPVPFDVLLVIATNIDPKQLVEEAFLRRIHYKIRVESPTLEQYEKIFSRYCENREIRYDPAAVRQLYQNFYHAHTIAPRGCHPRDVIDHLLDIAKYLETKAELSQDLVERAGRSYFLDFPTAD